MKIFLYRLVRKSTGSFIIASLALAICLYSTPALAVSMANEAKLVRIHIKLSDTSDIQTNSSGFTGTDSRMLSSSLSKLRAGAPKQLFKGTKESLKSQYHATRELSPNVTDLSRYYEISVPEAKVTQTLSELKALPTVTEAYVAPLPAPLPAKTPNLVPYQLYRQAAPKGIDANFSSTWPGGKGEQVKIADLEYSWSLTHEDLSQTRLLTIMIPTSTPVDPFNDTHHGTAVLGVIGADNNNFGMTGIAPNAQLRLVPTSTVDGYSVAGAIYAATEHLSAGDVMLIEQQTYADNTQPNTLVPVEWHAEVYDALQYANARGIIVVEAAGNGSQNLDKVEYSRAFSASRPDSGAIIVGAGQSCDWSTDRARAYFSTYGSRVNVQGWGECVATTGWYGSIWSGGTVDREYGDGFAGTSSASAMVAGIAGSFSSAYKQLNGVPPSPELVRSTLIATGTPQVNIADGKIGPRPNLAKALLATDLKAPTTPVQLTGKISKKKPVLSWKTASDNVAVAAYSIYRDNVLIKTIDPATTFTDTTAKAKKTYKYKVTASDKAGHVSGYSNTLSIKTP